MRAPAPRTAVFGALLSAGVAAAMLATAAVHGPAADPDPDVVTVAVVDGGGSGAAAR